MATQSFENLNFSFLVDSETRTVYLQEWEDGAWSEPDRFSLPVSLGSAPKKSRLARAAKSFGDGELRNALEEGLVRQAVAEPRMLWNLLQSCMHALALPSVTIGERCPVPAPLSSAIPSSSNRH